MSDAGGVLLTANSRAIEYFPCGTHMIIWKILPGRERRMDREKALRFRKTEKQIRGSVLARGAALVWGIFIFMTACMLPGCAVRMQGTEKIRDLEFTVLDKEDIPPELQRLIGENKETPFQLTYADQGKLYIAEGYGPQPTSGYSVEVTALYETQDAVRMETNLLGPGKGEETKEKTTFPYVAVQLEYIEKDVLFD